MSEHASVERLSLYLDAVMAPGELRRTREHLEECRQCRQRLDGLRRVVAGLEKLPAALPPEDMAARVRREIDLRGRRRGWPSALELRLPAPLSGSPPLHIFALVLALGAIVYLFAFGLEMRRARPTRIVLPATPEATAPPAAAARGSAELLAAERVRVLGGIFRRVDGVWVEEGLVRQQPDERLSLQLPPAAEIDPELMALAGLGAPLRLRVGERIVEIVLEPGAPAGA